MSGWLQRLLRRLAYAAPGGYSLRPMLHKWRGVKIGKRVWISQYVYIDEIHPKAVSIGDNVSIGIGTSIIAHIYWGKARAREGAGPVIIKSDVFIGPHCVVLPGVCIGAGAVIQAGSVVSRNVPSHVLFGHPPAQPLAEVTTPLTGDYSYIEFVRSLRPIRKKGVPHERR
jgi:acetyltransferase-like isoleucine patch superfamily enzyme